MHTRSLFAAMLGLAAFAPTQAFYIPDPSATTGSCNVIPFGNLTPSATWSNHGESQQEYDLEVTGGATPGGLEGRGKVFLSSDGKSVTRLSLKGVSRTSKRIVEANFEGK